MNDFKIIKREAWEISSNPNRVRALKKIIFKGVTIPKIKEYGQNISIPSVITNIINDEKNLKIFQSDSRANGGNIVLLVDCSGSMRNYENIGGFVQDFWSAIGEKIKLQVITFSSGKHERISYLDYIEKISDCNRIHEDETNLHDDLGHALRAAKIRMTGKTLVIVITDGLPEAEEESEYIPRKTLVKDIQKQIVKMENQNTKFFAIMLNKYSHEELIPVFRGKIFQTTDLNTGMEKLAHTINEFIKRL